MQNNKTDILIIGGGIAGCIAAIALSEKYSIALIDKLTEPKERIGESLAPAAQRILKQLNLLEGMNALEGELYLNNLGMKSYWGSEHVQVNDHLNNPDGFSGSLDRRGFEIYLRKAAEQRGVHCSWGSKLLRSNYSNQQWQVTAKQSDQEQDYRATFVVDASGRQAHFTRSIGIKRKAIDQLLACWMTLPNERKNTMSTIAAAEKGWWYSAVIPGNKRVVAFQTDSDLFEPALFKSVDELLALAHKTAPIADLVSNKNEAICLQGTTAANSTRLDKAAGTQWAAIGDAALSFDPLSSQGMFNAMASAMQLTDLLVKNGLTKNLTNTTYQHQIDSIWTHYLKHRNLFYSMEKRWLESEFWQRRYIN